VCRTLRLFVVCDLAVIFAPRRFLRITEQARSGDMMVMADFRAADESG